MLLLWISIVLFVLLAIFQLVVGVSNDAVNFLHSAVGSKVAPRKTILTLAGMGLLIGTFFSGGMMEVARSGIIYPDNLFLTELLMIGLSVSIIQILIIDSFNTLGFPTSTTISLIFGLIGGAMAIAVVKDTSPAGYTTLINTSHIFLIFAGILISVFFAFIMGAIVQFISRMVFTFRFKGRFVFFFAVAGALAITTILFLILKKGMGDFLPGNDWMGYLPVAGYNLSVLIFITLLLLFLALGYVFHVDIPSVVVLFGTFALSLSFAANDLVNFIGVPLTGLESIKAFLLSSSNDPNQFKLDFLNNDWLRSHQFNDTLYTGFFILAGIVMIITIFWSKKARSVVETEVYLGRQSSGYERFEPSPLSRKLVRQFLKLHTSIRKRLPKRITDLIDSRYQNQEFPVKGIQPDDVVYFDTIRASVNLVVASLLISLGTYLRVPLSTTFVVFMVAMGTSMGDQAWGRENAVYRISGVLSILGGWFVAAFLGFLGAFFLTLTIWWGGWIAALAAFALMTLFLWRSNQAHRRKRKQVELVRQGFYNESVESFEWLIEAGSEKLRRELLEVSKIYYLILHGLIHETSIPVREAMEKSIRLQQTVKEYKGNLFQAYSKLPEESHDAGHLLVQALDYLTELSNTLHTLAPPIHAHIQNQHKGVTPAQRHDLELMSDEMTSFFNFMIHLEKEKQFGEIQDLKQKQNRLLDLLEENRMTQIRRIRAGEGKTRVNVIYMELLGDSKNLLIFSYNLFQTLRDFHLQTKGVKLGY